MAGHWFRKTDVQLAGGAGRVSRREILRFLPAAGIATGMWGWSDLVAAQSAQLRKRGKACIVLWMQGGPSQFETFSPLTAHSHGGETQAMATSVPGIQIAEHLPHMARQMRDLCIVRSMTSKEGSHPRASYLLHTGYLPNPSVRYPAFGANVAQQLAEASANLPSYVRIGRVGREGTSGGLLGVEFDPFVMTDPHQPPDNTEVRTEIKRYQRRLSLAESMDRQLEQRGVTQEARDHQQLYQRAARMVLSEDMEAFDLTRESDQVRQAYGDSDFAAGCLLARRLVEAGVRFVEVTLGNWDTHQDNFKRSAELCRELDQPFAQLIRDLKDRGRLDDTLIVWMGEFGRTPRINPRGGRDHFPRAFNVALAGCGVQGGQVIGATDPSGSEVTDQPVTIPDLFRSLCAALGIDADYEHMSSVGRPIKIADDGQVVPGLLRDTAD